MNGRELRILSLLASISAAGFAGGHLLRQGESERAFLVFLAIAVVALVGGALAREKRDEPRLR